LQVVSKVEKLGELGEQQQIEYAMSKKNLLKQTPVITETTQKIYLMEKQYSFVMVKKENRG